MMPMQTAMTLKDMASALASQGIRGTELTVQVIILASVKTWIALMLRLLIQYYFVSSSCV